MEILRRCRKAVEEIERIQTRIIQRRAAADGMGSAMGGTVGHSAPSDRVGRIAAEIADLENLKAQREQEMDAETASACRLMDFVPDKESKVLYAYWIEQKSTGMIAEELHYTQAYVRRVKRGGEMLLGMISEERVNATLPGWYLEKMEKREE